MLHVLACSTCKHGLIKLNPWSIPFVCDPLGSTSSQQWVQVQFKLIWLEHNLADLGQIKLNRFDQSEQLLINDRIKLFNSIKLTRHDWHLATYHVYLVDIEFWWKYQKYPSVKIIVQLDLTIILHPEYKFGYGKMSNPILYSYFSWSNNNDSI